MKKVALTGKNGIGKAAIVDDSDYDMVNSYKWYFDGHGYPTANIKMPCGHYEKKMMHKFIMGAASFGKTLDHVDGNPLNNQRSNIRICTQSQNTMNRGRGKNNTSGFKGVRLAHGLIVAQITYRGKWKHLGTFKTKEEAAMAYDEAAIKYHGQFAKTNKSMGLY